MVSLARLTMIDTIPSSPRPWPRAIVFDLDGTLIDSAPDIARAAQDALTDYGVTVDAERARQWLGDGARKLIERALASAGAYPADDTIDALTARFSAIYQATPCRDTTLFPGALATLEQLRADNVRLAICTNKPHTIAAQVINALALDEHIDTVIGGGSYPLKPSPAGILACLDRLGVSTEHALYVGDMAVDQQAGHAAGLPVLLARFGYAGSGVEQLGANSLFSVWSDFGKALAELRN